MRIINISDTKASLSHLIKKVQETNESIIIGKAGKPVAILSAYREDTSLRELGGSWSGKVKMAEDFDDIDEQIIDDYHNSTIFPDK
ncbi:MAG: type II toxin-antitoxin system Phd/YefM family antitoxin [Methylococcaceae bacterium]|nr:type II toxin-antitoxin system Phd/YefM family antitoxin [Methylococcaceae bacterium]